MQMHHWTFCSLSYPIGSHLTTSRWRILDRFWGAICY
nr:MAG TPA: hypothetical protein [Caudoviricetes sp.]